MEPGNCTGRSDRGGQIIEIAGENCTGRSDRGEQIMEIAGGSSWTWNISVSGSNLTTQQPIVVYKVYKYVSYGP